MLIVYIFAIFKFMYLDHLSTIMEYKTIVTTESNLVTDWSIYEATTNLLETNNVLDNNSVSNKIVNIET